MEIPGGPYWTNRKTFQNHPGVFKLWSTGVWSTGSGLLAAQELLSWYAATQRGLE